MVVDPILSRHHRIEAFRVEIAIVDLMPARAQRGDQFGVYRGIETGLHRMGEQDEDPHDCFLLHPNAIHRIVSFPLPLEGEGAVG